MLRRVITLIAVVCSAAACATPGRPAAPALAERSLPRDLAAQVQQAERLGRALFEQDLASSRANSALLQALGSEPDPQIRGSIARRDGARWRVQFFDEKAQLLWQAEVGAFGAGVSLNKIDPPRPLDAEGERMARARATATAQRFQPCSSRYDVVVLPASLIGRRGFVVYLLAAKASEGEWIVGGHQRFLISEDGSSVLDHRSLSRGCLAVPASRRPAGTPSGAWVTHVVGDAPAETHVFISLLHQSPLFVGTRRGVWKVAGEKISFRSAGTAAAP